MVKAVIDRIEEEFAVAEISEGKTANIPLIFIPEAKEGDCIEIETAKVSRFYFASIDDDEMTVLTPKGKVGLSLAFMGEAKPGDPIEFRISHEETQKRKSRIRGMMDKLFE